MSLQALGIVASWDELEARLRGVAYELANCHNAETGRCCPSISYLAKRCKCSIPTIHRAINDLQDKGVITVSSNFIQGRQTTNSYSILLPRSVTGDTPEGITGDTPEGITGDIQNQEEEPGRGNGGGKPVSQVTPSPPVKEIINLYHELLPELPKVVKVTPKRKTNVCKRWKEDLTSLEEWREYFQYVRKSPFLMGKRPGTNGRPAFRANFEWLINQTNMVNVAEDKYHRR